MAQSSFERFAALMSFVASVQEQASSTSRRVLISSIFPAYEETLPELWERKAADYLDQRIEVPPEFSSAIDEAIEARNNELIDLAEVCFMKATVLRRYGHPDRDAIDELISDIWSEQEVQHVTT